MMLITKKSLLTGSLGLTALTVSVVVLLLPPVMASALTLSGVSDATYDIKEVNSKPDSSAGATNTDALTKSACDELDNDCTGTNDLVEIVITDPREPAPEITDQNSTQPGDLVPDIGHTNNQAPAKTVEGTTAAATKVDHWGDPHENLQMGDPVPGIGITVNQTPPNKIAGVFINVGEVRGWDQKQKDDLRLRLEQNPEVTSLDDFALSIAQVVLDTPDITDIESTEEKTLITYNTKIKLFGFVTMTVVVKNTITAQGTSTTDYPWYARFATKADTSTYASLAQRLQSYYTISGGGGAGKATF